MSLSGYGLYDPETGEPLDSIEIEMHYIQFLASLAGKRYVFPGEENSKPNEVSAFSYIQGVILGAEGSTPPQAYVERNCFCGARLNSYNPGPLCTKCQIQLLDPESQPNPHMLNSLRRYWPALYAEREMTVKVNRIENWRADVRAKKYS